MPPPMPNPSKRITANPVRPARYRPGKAVQEEDSSDDEDEEVVEQKKPATKQQSRPQPLRQRQTAQQEEQEADDEEGFVTEDDEDNDHAAISVSSTKKPVAPASQGATSSRIAPHISTQSPHTGPIASVKEAEESSEEDFEEEEESEEESSSEDEPQRKFQRPTFIRRADRQKSPIPGSQVPNSSKHETRTPQATTSTTDIDEQTRRLAQAELYIKDKLERDAIARSQGKKAWDDDEEVAPEDQVNDTDGLDPEAEYAAWKLRELKRLKRDREAIEAREREIEELERRRNLTQEERDAEDKDYIDKQRAEHDDGRGKANYLAKYHHKGAFFQDDEAAEFLKKRDLMGARFQDEVADKSVLPEYMRVRDMTKLGKKGRTRYTDLKGEDTGRFGEAVKRWKGSGYEDRKGSDVGAYSGVDERFMPDRDRDRDSRGPTGANASAVGQRKERGYARSRSRSRSPRRRRRYSRDRGDTYRPRQQSQSYSRSRSPPRRKRSPSAHRDREKRRRIDVD